jgi:hypothetical protein
VRTLLPACNKNKSSNNGDFDENTLLLWKLWFQNLAVPLFALPGSLFK